jgi:hypothetical protein
MPSAYHQTNLNVPTGWKAAVPGRAFRGLRENQAVVGNRPAVGSDEHSRDTISPETTGILHIVRGFPRLPQANDVTEAWQ